VAFVCARASLSPSFASCAQEYVKHIEKMHAELIQAWEKEERVKSLKIAIQVLCVDADNT
jgi:hypothetical protein